MGTSRTVDRLRRAGLELAGAMLDLVFTPRCIGCSTAEGRPFCEDCAARFEPPGEATAVAGLDALCAGVAYAGSVPDWMQRFKYPARGLRGLDPAPALAVCAWAAAAARSAPGPAPDAVVPVPLHPRWLRTRGFNPATLLAREIVRQQAGLRIAFPLVRTRETPSQTGLDRRGRRRNVRGAFAARGEPACRVWLVDDVATTGATLAECARTLRRAGSHHVVGVCAARTPRPVD